MKEKVPVTCPHCGHVGLEPAQAYSAVCKGCGEHIRVQEVLHPPRAAARPARQFKSITCFNCRGTLEVDVAAQSTMCRHCGTHVDLHDYRVTTAVARNFRTKGKLIVETTGYLLNTDSVAGEVTLKGRLLGKLVAERFLQIHDSAEIRGSFETAQLIIPLGTVFRWPEVVVVGGASVAGELIADLRATGKVVLKSTARYFGALHAGDLTVEDGAVLVGSATVGV